MRTTIQLDEDVAAAIEQLRRESGSGLSEAVNRLIRLGLMGPQRTRRFTQNAVAMGLKIDVSNVAEALEVLDGPAAR